MKLCGNIIHHFHVIFWHTNPNNYFKITIRNKCPTLCDIISYNKKARNKIKFSVAKGKVFQSNL